MSPSSRALLAAALLPCAMARAQPPRILVVLSEAEVIVLKGGKTHPTGYFLSELMVPLSELLKAGYQATIATPTGKRPRLDRSSDAAGFFKDEVEYAALKKAHDALPGLKKPASLARLGAKALSGYAAVFFPGGHAPLADLDHSQAVSLALRHFHERGKPTALICHGPAALLSARASDLSWPYKGYRMTAFSTAEERQAEAQGLGGEVEYYLDQALERLGGVISVAEPWRSRVIRDRELITAQNPQSDRALARELIAALAGADRPPR